VVGVAVADHDVGPAAHRAQTLDRARIDPGPQAIGRARISRLTEEQAAKQPAGIIAAEGRQRVDAVEPVRQHAAGHIAVLGVSLCQKMMQRLRRIETGGLQVRLVVQIPVLVEAAVSDAGDQRVRIEAAGPFCKKGSLRAVEHRLASSRTLGANLASAKSAAQLPAGRQRQQVARGSAFPSAHRSAPGFIAGRWFVRPSVCVGHARRRPKTGLSVW
jgi:hypothetical protein